MQQSGQQLQAYSIQPPAPRTNRGQFSSLDIANDHFLYFNGPTLIARPLKQDEPLKYFVHKSDVLAAKFSPDGKLIASIDQKGTLAIHQLGNKELHERKITENFYPNAKAIDWTADKKRICVVGSGKNSFGRVILVQSGSSAGEITGISANILCCNFRPQMPYHLALAGEEYLTKFFQGPPYKFVKSSQKNHTNYINCVKFSPNGDYLLTTGSDKKLILYNGTTFDLLIQKMSTHNGSIYGADWIDDKRFVTVSADKTIKIWRADNLQQINTIHCCSQQQLKNMKKIDRFQVAVKIYKQKIYSLGLNGEIQAFDIPDNQTKTILFDNNILKYSGWLQKPSKILPISTMSSLILDSNGRIFKLAHLQNKFKVQLITITNKLTQKSLFDGFYNHSTSTITLLWGDGNISQINYNEKFNEFQEIPLKQDSQAKYLVQSKHSSFEYFTVNNKINGYSNNKITNQSANINEDVTFVHSERNFIALGTIKGNIVIYDTEKLTILTSANVFSGKISYIQIFEDSSQKQNKFNIIIGDALGKLKILSFDFNSKTLNDVPGSLGNHQSFITGILPLFSVKAPGSEHLLTIGMQNKMNLWQKVSNPDLILKYKRLQEWKNIHNFGIINATIIETNQNQYLLTIGGDYLMKIWKITI